MTTRRIVTDEQAQVAAERIRLGQGTIMSEAKALGFSKRTALRAALTTLLGSREAYRSLLAAGRASSVGE